MLVFGLLIRLLGVGVMIRSRGSDGGAFEVSTSTRRKLDLPSLTPSLSRSFLAFCDSWSCVSLCREPEVLLLQSLPESPRRLEVGLRRRRTKGLLRLRRTDLFSLPSFFSKSPTPMSELLLLWFFSSLRLGIPSDPPSVRTIWRRRSTRRLSSLFFVSSLSRFGLS